MNYMKMVNFIHITDSDIKAEIVFQEREEIFTNTLNKDVIVPYYVVLEAMFQTAGRLARAITNNVYGGSIVSLSNFTFSRPILLNENITINAKILSFSDEQKSYFFQIILETENEQIIPEATLIIKQEQNILTENLNNKPILSKKEWLKYLGL